jgi:hypothetical protein
MIKQYYVQISGALFLIIAALHLLRLLNQWPANIAGWDVPMWFSVVAVIIAGSLAIISLKSRR